MYIFPHGGKSMPYFRVFSAPYAEDLIGTVIDQMRTDNSKTRKLKSDHAKGAFKDLGKTVSDDKGFQDLLDREGVINLRVGNFDDL